MENSKLEIIIISLFPDFFNSFKTTALIKKAIDNNLLSIQTINPRDFSKPPHNKVDDTPYGGGSGMVLSPEPLSKSISRAKEKLPNAKVIFMSANGKQLNQNFSKRTSRLNSLIIVCGRYEGIDQRVIDLYADYEISIGDYVIMGGETASLVYIETIARHRKGVLGNEESIKEESFSYGLLEHPQYTKPQEFNGLKVPEVLLSGNHQEINRWRKEQSLLKTQKNRPDLTEPKLFEDE